MPRDTCHLFAFSPLEFLSKLDIWLKLLEREER